MDSPGIFELVNSAGEDFTVTEAGTQIGEPAEGFEGALSVALQARFLYGSGGTSCKLYVQSSLDQGTTWFDVACFAFGAAPATRLLNLSALTALSTPTAPADAALPDNTALDGPLGDRFRAKLVSVGTYAGPTVLSLRGCAR